MSIYLRASVNLSIRVSNQLLSSLTVSRNVSVLPGKVRGSFCLKGIHLSLESCLTDFLNNLDSLQISMEADIDVGVSP